MTAATSAVTARWAELTSTRRGRVAAGVVTVLAVWLLAGAFLPNGLPLGIVLYGLVLGSLTALTAMGLVLIYRSSRIINFAQVEIGGLSATVAVVLVTGWHVSYFVALPVGLAVAVATGAAIDRIVVRRFFDAPRLILTVATIGLLQILGAAEIELPRLFVRLQNPFQTFKTPFHLTFTVGPIVFHGDDVVAMVVVPVVVLGLAWFLGRSDTGIAIRGAADSNERALLLGIPVRGLSLVTWMVAAGLSGLAAMLTAPILGPSLGFVGGPTLLLAPLAAAVVARMDSLPIAAAAGLGIGVFQQAVFGSWPRSSAVDVGEFLVILVALLIQRRRITRVDESGLGGYVAVREVRPIPTVLRGLREVRVARWAGVALLGVVAGLWPLTFTADKVILVTYIALYAMIAVSLVVLAGWAGQISLGQFAFAGIGAATTASLVAHRVDLFLALALAAAAAAFAALVVGIPALRIRGLYLAVTTLAFAVPVSTYLLNSAYFPSFDPHHIDRPAALKRFNLESPLTFYYFCLLALVVFVVLARNFRRSRAGRVVLAVRDNERAAAAFAISPTRAKLTAFMLSGALAGFAGGLFGVAERGIGFAGFDPLLSTTVFVMVVVGGLGSLPGAILGAVYVEGAQYFLHDPARLLATGAGLLVLLMVAPGGLGEVVFGLRDRALRALARRKALSVPSLAERPDLDAEPEPAGAGGAPATIALSTPDGGRGAGGAPLLSLTGIDASYGQIQVLFGVDMTIEEGEIVALLGTNGAGKSTVLRVIAGLLPGGRGRIAFDGTDLVPRSAVERVKAGIVTVPGGRGVFGSLTVAENLRLAGWLARRDPAFLEQAMAEVFRLFPVLRDRLDERASFLSGGQQQMLTLAQALLCRPRLLMIDELSLGLAPTIVASLLDVVRQFNAAGTTVVLVEQSLNVATSIADRAFFMEKGQVRFSGPTAELVDRPDLARSVFLRTGVPARRRRAAAAAPVAAGAASPLNGAAPILETSSISRRFGGVMAIDGIDLTVREGRILGIIGSNGAGKTTLFDICSGFLSPDGGRVRLAGRDVTDLGAPERAALGLGRSFQDARLFPSLTVSETLATALERHIEVREPMACVFRVGAVVDSEKAAARRVAELIELMGLERYRDAFISELSTGTRRIVELCCALAHDPKVLLLDEPSSGIAQRESEALAGVLLTLKERTGATLAVIEHDIPLVTSIADELVCLHLGQVICRGRPADVLADPEVVASYLGTDQATITRSGRAARAGRAASARAGRAARAAGAATPAGRRRAPTS